MVSPASRFAGGGAENSWPLLPEETRDWDHGEQITAPGPRTVRKVSTNGLIRLVGKNYGVGRFLAGEMVEAEIGIDGLIGIYHRGVLVATAARHHPLGREAAAFKRRPSGGGTPSKTPGKPVLRLVDRRGSISFAGARYRVGNPFALKQVEVRLVGDMVQIWLEGKLIRTHPARHDREKEHGAFANPGGRPRHKKAS
jgi:hypothetical protein